MEALHRELVAAARAGDATTVSCLLSSHEQASAMHSPSGAASDDALCIACKCGHLDVVKVLMDRGAEAATRLVIKGEDGALISTSPLFASLRRGEVFNYLVTRQPELISTIYVTSTVGAVSPLLRDEDDAKALPKGAALLVPRDPTYLAASTGIGTNSDVGDIVTRQQRPHAEPLLHSILAVALFTTIPMDTSKAGLSLIISALLLPGTGIAGTEVNSLGETAAQFVRRLWARQTCVINCEEEGDDAETLMTAATSALLACKDAGLDFTATGKSGLNAFHTLCAVCAQFYGQCAGGSAVRQLLVEFEGCLAAALHAKDERGAYPLDFLVARGAVLSVVDLFTAVGAPHSYGTIGRDGRDSSTSGVLALLKRKVAVANEGRYHNCFGQSEWIEQEFDDVSALLHSPVGREAWHATDVFGQTALLILAPAYSAEPLIRELMAAKAPLGRLNTSAPILAKNECTSARHCLRFLSAVSS